MMTTSDLRQAPGPLKIVIGIFLFVLSVGYASALILVENTSSMAPRGIAENYLGNEEDENADVMKFRKSDREIFTIIHTHVLSLAVIFLILAVLVCMSNGPSSLKNFLMIEPMISVVFTFGGIYLVWRGINWFAYIVMFSGLVMHVSFFISVALVFRTLLSK